jgi:S1-C subfamily serine protease
MGSGDGFEDDADDLGGLPLLPPDDRLWRHPSEVAHNPLPAAASLFAGGGSDVGADGTIRLATDRRVWAVALVAGAVGAFLVVAIQLAGGGLHTTKTIRTIEEMGAQNVPPGGATTATTSSDQLVETVADRVRPAIVRLEVQSPGGTASGSGILFRSDGEILTNEHLTHNATHITVVTARGRSYDGVLVGSDQETDVAVVRVLGTGPWPVAVLGSATGLRTGQSVLAIGSALGLEGGPSVSRGVVSALGRSVNSADGAALLDMIQTDAAVVDGSSGGALVDLNGEVVGLCTDISLGGATPTTVPVMQESFLGFATPIDIAHQIAEELIETGRARHVWLGILGADLDPVRADTLNLDGGALVQKVQAASPAEKAGLQPGDVIATVDGSPVVSVSELMVSLRAHEPGDQVVLGVLRATKPMIPMTVVLGQSA